MKASTGESELLHSFGSQEGGQDPRGGLTYLDGYLYGVTAAGGAGKGGTVFRLKKGGGDFTVLYSFTDKRRDGFSPSSPLLPFSPGGGEPVALYGTTSGGGSHGDGTVYKITPDGTKTTLSNFVKAKGTLPQGPLVAVDGVIYGTAPLGGPFGKGTLFAFTP